MFINIVIPVCSLHIKYIDICLASIFNQTRLPDKIVLVANEYSRYKEKYDNILNNFNNVTLIKIDTWEKPGINRNIGSKECTSGIILYQDVDDVLHPQRCEIVEKCFEKYDCSLLLHLADQEYQYKNTIYSEYNMIKREFVNETLINETNLFNSDEHVNFSYYFGNRNNKNKHSSIHHGMCCVSADVMKENIDIWKNFYSAEDLQFVSDITRKYKNTIILLLPLVVSVGTDHIRLIDERVCHKKTQKEINYDPVLL